MAKRIKKTCPKEGLDYIMVNLSFEEKDIWRIDYENKVAEWAPSGPPEGVKIKRWKESVEDYLNTRGCKQTEETAAGIFFK